jgi:hypothetical protein
MRKILIFLASDGWKNTLVFLLKSIKSFFYYQSDTICFYAQREDIESEHRDEWKGFDCRIIQNIEDIQRLNFPRLSLLPCKEWIKAGGVLCVLQKNDDPVGFGWIHFHQHTIKYVGNFDLGNDTAWVGPQFVHKDYRGNGLQKFIVLQCISRMPDNIKVVITSVNQSNLPSLRSYEKMNFCKGVKVSAETGIFSFKSSKSEILNTEASHYIKLR